MTALIIVAIILGLAAVLNSRKLGIKRYTFSILYALDQLGNSILGGWPDETISSRCGRGCARYWYWRWLAKFLNWLDPNHVWDAIKHERDNSQLPPELR
jgi:hypothetical protein